MIRAGDVRKLDLHLPLLLVLLAAGTTCSPEYESGKTACSPTPPQCPDGYVCSGIRCYLRGQEPINPTVNGGSGGGGMGGSNLPGFGGLPLPRGGSGGSAMAGAGGMGEAGAGGSAMAGAGGTNAGGSGGAGGMSGTSARMKFCNRLPTANATSVEVTIGSVKLTAGSGACSPVAPAQCPTLPGGTLPLTIVADGQMVHQSDREIQGGTEYLLVTFVGNDGAPKFDFRPLRAIYPNATTCAAFSLPTSGAGGAGGADGGSGGAGGSGGPDAGPPGPTCPAANPVACTVGTANACFPTGTACATAIQCGSTYRACSSPTGLTDCVSSACDLPAEVCLVDDPMVSDLARCAFRKCCSRFIACAEDADCAAQVRAGGTITHPLWTAFISCSTMFCSG